MPNFAILENGMAVNIVVAETEYAAAQGWVAIPEHMDIGCVFNGSSWSDPNAPTTEEVLKKKASEVREKRNAKLSASDWTQVADAPVDKEAWAVYRQALRDITNQNGFPWNIQWPEILV